MTALALLAPGIASAQQSGFNPPSDMGAESKLKRDHHRHHRDWRDDRRGERHDRDDWRRKKWSRHDRDDWGQRGGDNRDWGIRRDKRYGKDFYGDQTPAGTYSGGWSAWRDPGNGTYSHSDGDGVGGDGMKIIEVPTRNGPKVLGVAPDSFEGACDRSGGVCIIRPGN
ncbi:MAG: hypothetical protein CML30_18060 [Rhizobiales bacterium]|nr:hypothetical protein [Hyphomicrobiales bacterium]|tara:strand:- start:1327 stop:1830 length:504 start_codon:yes stop_codon:yes gene_type:complete